VVAGSFYVLTHFDYKLQMPLTLFKIITLIAPLFFHDIYVLFNFNQISVYTIDFFVPVEGVDFSLYNLMIFLFVCLVNIWIEKVDFCFFSSASIEI